MLCDHLREHRKQLFAAGIERLSRSFRFDGHLAEADLVGFVDSPKSLTTHDDTRVLAAEEMSTCFDTQISLLLQGLAVAEVCNVCRGKALFLRLARLWLIDEVGLTICEYGLDLIFG